MITLSVRRLWDCCCVSLLSSPRWGWPRGSALLWCSPCCRQFLVDVYESRSLPTAPCRKSCHVFSGRPRKPVSPSRCLPSLHSWSSPHCWASTPAFFVSSLPLGPLWPGPLHILLPLHLSSPVLWFMFSLQSSLQLSSKGLLTPFLHSPVLQFQ